MIKKKDLNCDDCQLYRKWCFQRALPSEYFYSDIERFGWMRDVWFKRMTEHDRSPSGDCLDYRRKWWKVWRPKLPEKSIERKKFEVVRKVKL